MEPAENLNEIERRLSKLQPAFGSLSREKMLFEAGRASAQTKTHWGWPAATTTLSVAVMVLGVMLAGDRSRASSMAVAPTNEKKGLEETHPAMESQSEIATAFPPNAGLHSYLAMRNEAMERGIDSVKSVAGDLSREGAFQEKAPLRAFDRTLPEDSHKSI